MRKNPSALLLVLFLLFGCAEVQTQLDIDPISEANFVPLGGIDQWVTIRGKDRQSPVLLHVHGGPGNPFSAFSDEFAPFEDDYTIVQWDQRGVVVK